jgi:hypothetical protein
MACDTMRKPNQTIAQRATEVEKALRKLKADLLSGRVQVKIAPNGAITFANWGEREGLTDACAYRVLTFQNSGELRSAIARAEAMSGRKVNPRAIAAGHHSHDGGRTWDKH